MEKIEYRNLTEFLLGPIRQRPAMYLGEARISNLPNFIIGYNIGFSVATGNNKLDEYFGDNGFLEWFHKKYNVEQASFWETSFLERAGNDEKKALDLYFQYLEEYSIEKNSR